MIGILIFLATFEGPHCSAQNLDRVATCQGKTKFSPSQGILKKCQGNFGHLTHVRELSWNFVTSCQGIVREFCHDIIFSLKLPSYDKGCTWVVFM